MQKRGALRVAVIGADGRMGRSVCALARADSRFLLCAEIRRHTPRADYPSLIGRADCVVDFSAPAASLAAAAAAARLKVPSVIGTTGFTPAQAARVKALARRAPILLSANMSPGMNVLLDLAQRAARALRAFDLGVWEIHHNKKRDAPSGTALLLARALEKARPGERPPLVSLRAGDVVGDHTVLLAGPGERLELCHRAHSRDVFARGALEAALWLAERRPGLYSMREALGL